MDSPSNKTEEIADVSTVLRTPWSINQANRCFSASAKVRIAKFLNNSYQSYESGYELNTAPGMLITPSS
jgi:hypothetical protein